MESLLLLKTNKNKNKTAPAPSQRQCLSVLEAGKAEIGFHACEL